jgi:hypothetical protein
MIGLKRACGLAWAAALGMLIAAFPPYAVSRSQVVEVKVGITTLTRSQQVDLWRRVEEYATVDALEEFCGRQLSLVKRTWAAISPCVETSSLKKVAGVFRSKKKTYLQAWEKAHGDPEKKKALCQSWSAKLNEYSRIIDSHIAEARGMCDACLFC